MDVADSRITSVQKAFLDSLVCERFSECACSRKIIASFRNPQGELLLDYARKNGFDEDDHGGTAFYLIRTRENLGLFFFSLKCGELFSPLKEDEMRARLDEYVVIRQALLNIAPSDKVKRIALQKLKAIGERNGLSLKEVLNVIVRDKSVKKKLLNRLEQDLKIEPNKNISRVSRTFSGVQLVHFCANKNVHATDFWEKSGIGRPMGEVLFWNFIAPVFSKVQSLVGCEFAFLFAADMSSERVLINYYERALKFIQDLNIGANKPSYDFCCAFMCQSLRQLGTNRKLYFDHFNDTVA